MDEWEEIAKDHFIWALKADGRGEWRVSRTEVVVDQATNINFDYELQLGDKFIALELFRLVDDAEEIKRSKLWNEITDRIVAELRRRGVQGYTLQTPWAFNVERRNIDKFVVGTADALEAAITRDPRAEVIRESGIEATRRADFPTVSGFGIGPGGPINPTADALQFIEQKLPKKNQQLSTLDHERVVVIVNWRVLVGPENMIEACTQIDFSQFANIDKVFVDLPGDPPKVHLLYDREIYDAFQENGAAPKQITELFVSWMANHLNQKHARAFPLVKEITEREHTLLWLPALSRAELTRVGEDFLAKGEFGELDWILDHLKDDPDPSIENDADDPEGRRNYHLQVERGQDQRIIHSVRGRLCWLLQRIVVNNRVEDYERVFDIVKAFATGDNLYVRLQATIPLMELAKRRLLDVRPGVRFMSAGLAGDVKDLALQMLEENRNYPVMLEWIALVFISIRDLDQGMASTVLERLLLVEDSDAAVHTAWMASYFSFFRANQFKNLERFDSASVQTFLITRLSTGAGRFRSAAMQHFRSFLEHKQIELETALPYLNAAASGKAHQVVCHNLFSIAAKHATVDPEAVGALVEVTVRNELRGLDEGRGEVWHDKDFAAALQLLENAGPAHSERVARLRELMVPYRDRIITL